ncbi:MAG: hypothetical protein DDT19_01796 [Syntrophomonadaceae bacterium]|nr:hypothetical protein [Bacillota bacterium]
MKINVGIYEVKINIFITVFLIAASVALILSFIYFKDDKDAQAAIAFSVSIIVGIAVIYTAFYIGQSMKINLRRDMLKQSIEVINRVEGMEISKVRSFIRDELSSGKISQTPEEVYKMITADKDLCDAVITVLGYFEDISILIQKGYVEEELLYMSFCPTVPFYYKALEPYINKVREQRNDPSIYIEFTKLSTSWSSKKYLYSNKKVRDLI